MTGAALHRSGVRDCIIAGIACGGFCVTLVASDPSNAGAQETDPVTTHHQIRAAGGTLRYTARAGFIPIRHNDTGEVHGNVFFMSYALDGADPSTRPLTFLWNGGPGSNSVLVHLTGFGPRRIRDNVRATATGGHDLEDNPDTWLEATDLVFVDPIGTGFSRPTSPEFAAEFYSVLGDIASITEFIRAWRTRFDALQRPVFLAGESYGVWRAAGVAESMIAGGQSVTGVMLISGGIPFGPVASDAERTAMFVPNRTAAALHHGKLTLALQREGRQAVAAAERWARDVYAPALARRESLSAVERDSIIAGLARYTGVRTTDVDRTTLSMTSPQFRSALLESDGLTAGRYDMRVTSQPSERGRAVAVRRYLRNELGFESDLAYQGLETGYTSGAARPSVGARWEWNQTPPGAQPAGTGSGDGPPGGAQPWLRRAMAMDSSLVAFVAAGLYDSLNSCADNAWIVEHVEPSFRSRVVTGCYEGGHMMYDGADPRRALGADVSQFIRSAIAGSRRQRPARQPSADREIIGEPNDRVVPRRFCCLR